MAPLPLSAELEQLKKCVCEAFEEAKPMHDAARTKWNEEYRLYRSYQDLKRSYANTTGGRDVDSLLRDAQSVFDANLFIPYTFTVIETTLPRMLAQNPKLLYQPARQEWEENVKWIKLIMDRQQSYVRYPLVLQDVGKDGLIYGLGVQFSFWDRQEMERKYWARPTVRMSGGPEWVIKTDPHHVRYEGANAERVDNMDFFWDPIAHDVESMRYCLRRKWMDKKTLRQRFESGAWTLPAGWTIEDVEALGSEEARDSIWAEKMTAAGMSGANKRGSHVHEIWQYHERGQVITMIDRELPVQQGVNPMWHGDLPYQIARPTRVPGEMVGISEPAAIKDLQEEMNSMRSQRRDNANVVMQRPFAYFDGLVDPGDVQFGPGMMIPVDGDPRELLFPIPLEDLPGSSYQEEARLQSDIERTSGIDDSVSGAGGDSGGAASTATGVQLVQAAANVRIANKTTLVELELMQPAAHQWLALTQQHITEAQEIQGPAEPGEFKPYTWYRVGPEELQGEFYIEVEAGSSQPNNEATKRANAKDFMLTFGNNPLANQRMVTQKGLEGFGISNPEAYLVPEVPELSVQALGMIRDELANQGQVDPNYFNELVSAAMAADQAAQEQAAGGQGQLPPGAQQGQGDQPPAELQAA